MAHKETITREEMSVRLQKSNVRRIEYSQKSAKYMNKQVRNECIVNDFNALVLVKRVFPNLMDIYNLLGKVYNLNGVSIYGIIKTETERARLTSRARLASL